MPVPRSALAALLVAITIGCASGSDVPSDGDRAWDAQRTAEVSRLFRAGDYTAVVERANLQVRGAVDEGNLQSAILRAIALRRLGRDDEATRAFEATLPVVRRLRDVSAERAAVVFYDLAELYGRAGKTREAFDTVEAGLRLRPQSTTHQLLAAYWLEKLGDAVGARMRYEAILATVVTGCEAHAVAEARLARLDRSPHPPPAVPATNKPVHFLDPILLVPFNFDDDRIALDDQCLLLESTFGLRCVVNPPLEIPETPLLAEGRRQYQAERVATLLDGNRPGGSRRAFVVAVTTHDLTSGSARYVFSSQFADLRIAVVSSYRLSEQIPEYWDAGALVNRRLQIQLVSAVGNGFGLERPTFAHCPLAYPNSVEAFLNKSDVLCDSTRRQWREKLARFGEPEARMDAVRLRRLANLERHYLIRPQR